MSATPLTAGQRGDRGINSPRSQVRDRCTVATAPGATLPVAPSHSQSPVARNATVGEVNVASRCRGLQWSAVIAAIAAMSALIPPGSRGILASAGPSGPHVT